MDKEKLNDIVCESSSDYTVLNDAYNYIEHLEQQCKKQKEVVDKLNDLLSDEFLEVIGRDTLLDILKEGKND